jgi:hypothetical protein
VRLIVWVGAWALKRVAGPRGQQGHGVVRAAVGHEACHNPSLLCAVMRAGALHKLQWVLRDGHMFAILVPINTI